MKPFIVAANWKMHKSPRETTEFFSQFLSQLGAQSGSVKNEMVFFVPAIDLVATQAALGDQKVARVAPGSATESGSAAGIAPKIGWGAQNCYFETKGAFTGENSPALIAELGATHTLVGHSERRALFHETDEDTAKKVKALQAVGVTPMLCVGETLQEREAGQTANVIVRQLRAGLAARDSARQIVIAYEPVWAIGTGKVATPAQAGEAHAVLRKALQEIGGADFASKTPILYGGSVKPENANEIAQQKEVVGFLVGGASLDVASFLDLCKTEKTLFMETTCRFLTREDAPALLELFQTIADTTGGFVRARARRRSRHLRSRLTQENGRSDHRA
jgi:triosephosphate isomerase